MENLEEVLQALDDFQKMRPTEIPRELEDYLCWVAKTGDPVYQWPMVKTLFREKLTRVMTDFYESCPTLELAPCSNVEHFNYDTMKSNLLERLESFANAPFTVQRICELLTSPRKEYNRVDKFMRAIEKNILVVSTREPGSIARRGEMGDGMVNGSVDEETASITQQQQQQQSLQPSPPSLQQSQPVVQLVQSTPQDVEMEYWEKDCGTTIPLGMHNVGNEPPSLHTAIPPASTLAKNVFTVDEAMQEKFERARVDVTPSNLISTTADFSTISNLTSQIHSHESSLQPVSVVSVVQNPPLTSVRVPSSDLSIGSADVMETIVNENIDTQTSLDMDNGKNEITMASTTMSMSTATTTMPTSVPITMTATTTTTTTTTTATIATAATSTIMTTIMMTPTTTITPTAITTTTTTTTTATAAEMTTATATITLTSIPSAIDSINKLQTIIQDEDFKSGDNDNSFELYVDKSNKNLKVSPTTIVNTEAGVIHSTKSGESIESNSNNCNNTKESMLNENLLNTDDEIKSDILSNNIETLIDKNNITNKSDKETTPIADNIDRENLCLKDNESNKTAVFTESQTIEKNNTVSFDKCVSAVIVSSDEALHELEKSKTHFKNVSMTISSKDNSIAQQTESTELIDKVLQSTTRAISFKSDDNRQIVQNPEFHEDNLKIAEVFNDKPSIVESIIPVVPMTNVKNAKETTLVIDTISSAVEITGDSNISIPNVSCQFTKGDKLISIEHDSTENMEQDNKSISCKVKGNETSVIESVTSEGTHELMEIDEGEPLPTFQHDELMEPETMEELSKS